MVASTLAVYDRQYAWHCMIDSDGLKICARIYLITKLKIGVVVFKKFPSWVFQIG